MKYLVVIIGISMVLGFAVKHVVMPEKSKNKESLIIRIAEIEIDSIHLNEYLSILDEESKASVKLEPGVICIFPMYEMENPTHIRILEIYRNKDAYKQHLQSPHFKHYKTTTLHMVKSLRLVDMNAIDAGMMNEIFKKINEKALN
jgi:quinol monooxygenase YgiN